MSLFTELKKIYKDMEIEIVKEKSYIADNNIREEKKLLIILDKKKILRDKVEKLQKRTIEKLSQEEKADIGEILHSLLEMEQENRKNYDINLNMLRQKIVNLSKEKKIKNTYFKPSNKPKHFDQKK